MVSAFAANIFNKNFKTKNSLVEKKLFKQLKFSSLLGDKSSSGGALAGKYTKKITRVSGFPRSRRSERSQESGGSLNYGRFVGILDEATGMTRKDVDLVLNCRDADNVEDIDWPFDNIAVFSLKDDGNERFRDDHSSRSSNRVVLQSRRSRARKALNGIQKLGFFESLQWDANVTQFAAEVHQFSDPNDLVIERSHLLLPYMDPSPGP
jgi:hypothetical protein